MQQQPTEQSREENPARFWFPWSQLWGNQDALAENLSCHELPASEWPDDLKKVWHYLQTKYPELLTAPPGKSIELNRDQARALFVAVQGVIETSRRFDVSCRFLEVIDYGNRLGLWRIPMPYIPLPIARRRILLDEADHALFAQHQDWFQDLARAIHAEPMPEEIFWGLIFALGLSFGGLLDTRRLWGLPQAILDAPEHLQFVEIAMNAAEDPDALPWRHFLDPLTRWLLTKQRKQGIPPPPDIQPTGANLFRLIRHAARFLGIQAHLPANLSALRTVSAAFLTNHLPPFLVAIAGQHLQTASLPTATYRRMLGPTSEIHPRRANSPAKDSLPEPPLPATRSAEAEAPTSAMAKPTELGRIIRAQTRSDPEPVQRWGVENSSTPILQLLVEWITDWLMQSDGSARRKLAPKTIYTYLNVIGTRLVRLVDQEDPRLYQEAEDFLDIYWGILNDNPSPSSRHVASRAIESFHAFLVERYDLMDVVDPALFNRRTRGPVAPDANLVLPREIEALDKWLTYRHANNTTFSDIALLVAHMGFYLGLRRKEVMGLRLRDIEPEPGWDLLIQPHRYRRLKTRNANRVLPLRTLLPASVFEQLVEHYQSLIAQGKSGDDWLFFPNVPYYNPEALEKAARPVFDEITDGLQQVTGDDSLRFHHLRHSFANRWLLILLNATEAFPEWMPDLIGLAQATERREALLGKGEISHRALSMVAQLMGHASPSTTLAHYIHITDLLLGHAIRELLPEMTIPELKRLTGIQDSWLREIRHEKGSNHPADIIDALLDRQLPQPGFSRFPASVALKMAEPKDDFQRAMLLTEAVNHLAGETRSAVDLEYPWPLEVLQHLKMKADEMPAHTRRPRTGQSQSFIAPPGTQQARSLANRALAYLNGSSTRAARPDAERLLNLFGTGHWGESPLDVILPRVPDVKHWLGLLKALDLEEHFELIHLPARKRGSPGTKRQRLYWEQNLGVDLSRNAVNEMPHALSQKGAILFRQTDVDRRGVSLGLYGVVWALLLTVLDSSI